MAFEFHTLPPGVKTTPEPFTLTIPDEDVAQMLQFINRARIPPASFYNKTENPSFGISRSWLLAAQGAWSQAFSWSATESKINSYPNYKTTIPAATGGDFTIHFAALFSKRPDAIPIIFMHGWPGSFMEFFPLIDLLVEKYTPETLPYHVIVPSIPDYGLSSGPREDVEVTMEMAAEVMNGLMVSLGFDAYVAQGGDIGSFLASEMCGRFEECKAFHLNMLFIQPSQSEGLSIVDCTPAEQEHLMAMGNWVSTASAYAYEQGTRPSTIGLALSTNPMALLAWVGEKFIQGADPRQPLSLDTILSMTSFYWLTDTFPRSMWPYRFLASSVGAPNFATAWSTSKPFGYSSFPKEQVTVPKKWAEKLFPNLVLHKAHGIGGHFAALEQPTLFLEDVEEFLEKTRDLVVPAVA